MPNPGRTVQTGGSDYQGPTPGGRFRDRVKRARAGAFGGERYAGERPDASPRVNSSMPTKDMAKDTVSGGKAIPRPGAYGRDPKYNDPNRLHD